MDSAREEIPQGRVLAVLPGKRQQRLPTRLRAGRIRANCAALARRSRSRSRAVRRCALAGNRLRAYPGSARAVDRLSPLRAPGLPDPYQIRADMGETIEVVQVTRDTPLPSNDYFDFLLFDRTIALVHDYGSGPVGEQTGGWLVRDAEPLRRLEAKALELRSRAVSLRSFLAEAGF